MQSTYEKLSGVISDSKIWDGGRSKSHGFLLSPSVYKITKDRQKELDDLGIALYDCLLGLSHIATIVYDKSLNYVGDWLLFRRVFSSGVPKIYHELQGLNVKSIPKLLKVDFMIDQEGNLKIAEIDGHNKHGLGYSTLGKRFRDAMYPDAKSFPGAVASVAEQLKKKGKKEVRIFYADQERFYLPEFEVAKSEFENHDIECLVMSETEASVDLLKNEVFLDLPFLYNRVNLYDVIIRDYKLGHAEFIIPPKPFLGAKGVLALLRNDERNEGVERLLRSFIKNHSLDLLRRYIPETFLVGRQLMNQKLLESRLSEKRFVLKESISSGMKGTVFSDESAFEETFLEASSTNMNWILQEEVQNQPQTFSWYEDGGSGEPSLLESSDWFMRVTAQYVCRKVGDVIVTACRDKAVHGGKKCLQLGTIIV